MIDMIQILILGLSLGGVYALMSSGLTLVFGVMRIVNLAHAVLMVAAAYIAYWGFVLLGNRSHSLSPDHSACHVRGWRGHLQVGVYQHSCRRSLW